MAGLSTRRVGAEPGLVPRLAGGWLRPCALPTPAPINFVINISSFVFDISNS